MLDLVFVLDVGFIGGWFHKCVGAEVVAGSSLVRRVVVGFVANKIVGEC